MDEIQDRWWAEGKCFGDPLHEWMSNSLPADEQARAVLAQAKCSGCPVFYQCGLDVLANRDIGTIRAGQALDDVQGPKLRSQYAQIREQINMLEPPTERDSRRADWPRRCDDCARVMRPRRSTATDWPGTVASYNRHLCNTCHNKQWRSSNGSL